MNTKKPVIVYDLIKDCVAPISFEGVPEVHFLAGRPIQVLKELQLIDNAPDEKNEKYPLIVLFMPYFESRGSVGYYGKVLISRMIISDIVNPEVETKDVYASDGVYKKVLYPIYEEFMTNLDNSLSVISDGFIKHQKRDLPSVSPIGEGLSDYVCSIELTNIELILNQFKTC